MDSNFLKVYTKHLTASQAKNEHPLPSVSALVTMYIYIYILQKCMRKITSLFTIKASDALYQHVYFINIKKYPTTWPNTKILH